MPQKASTPWSTRTVAEGGTDSPVGDLVPVPDEITPVVNTGFISLAGKYRGIPSDDLQFTFQDPNQALAAGASLFVEGINMLRHNILILGILDSSGNSINVDLAYKVGVAAVEGTPFNSSTFDAGGFNSDFSWRSNEPGDGQGTTITILDDSSENLSDSWQFYKMGYALGTVGQMLIRSNEGADAGTISTAYLRIV